MWLAHARANHGSSSKLQVVASFYPMAEFARQIGGNNIQVTQLVKPGTEPHDYDPSPQDIAAVYKANVLVYNGAGLERWADKIQSEVRSRHIVAVRASDGIQLKTADPSDIDNQSPTDPHVWMDPMLAIKEVSAIKNGLIAADPTHQATYTVNAERYTKQLQILDADFHSGLTTCQSHNIVTSHQAFGYLAAEYGLQATGIAGLSPDSEPSPEKLAQITDFVTQHHVGYIFFETLVSPKLAQTIARETQAQTIAFNPLEGLTDDEIAQGKNYISVQKDNLRALRTALHCT